MCHGGGAHRGANQNAETPTKRTNANRTFSQLTDGTDEPLEEKHEKVLKFRRRAVSCEPTVLVRRPLISPDMEHVPTLLHAELASGDGGGRRKHCFFFVV